jgi:WD40 repeat protein
MIRIPKRLLAGGVLALAGCGGEPGGTGPDPDTTNPTVQITAPAAGAVGGTVEITATAADDRGIAGVTFSVDGQAIGLEDVAAPFVVSWNSASVADGSRTLRVVARDSAGNTASAERIVVVGNAVPLLPGSIRVVTATAGVEPDVDGFEITVAGQGAPRPAPSSGEVTFAELPPGSYGVQLGAVAGNCTADAVTKTAVVAEAAETVVTFAVTCAPPSAWSQLAYFTNSGVFRVQVDGSDHARISQSGSGTVDQNPDWSPDGTRIAFAKFNTGGIYVMEADGSNQVRLTDQAYDNAPDWSPDGARIAFTSSRDGATDIWVVNADGSGAVNLTASGQTEGSPSWSPDGQWIAFSRDWEIWIMNADGTGQVRLTNDGFIDGAPAWSPDGALIAFTSNRDGVNEIYVMAPDGSGLTRLTHNDRSDTHPTWSRDGQRLAAESASGTTGILVFDRDGSGATLVPNTTSPSWGPDWRHH